MLYHAFISYSHFADEKLAPSIQFGLHKLAKPFYKFRALNVFRDATDLSVAPSLWEVVADGLDKSEFLILLASPKAAGSKWVKKEIDYWLATKLKDNIILGLTDGEIVWDDEVGNFDKEKSTAIPEGLFGKPNQDPLSDWVPLFDSEPLWVDFRGVRSDKDLSLQNPEFKQKVLLIAAKLHGKTPSQLAGEEVDQHQRNKRMRNSVIIALVALMIFAFYEKAKSDSRFILAKSNELAANAALNIEKDPTLSLRLAEASLELNPENQQAQDILFQIAAESDKYPLYEELAYFPSMADGVISGDGEKFYLAIGKELISLGTHGESVDTTEFPSALLSIDISSDDSAVVILDTAGKCFIWNTASKKYWSLKPPADFLHVWKNVSFSPQGRYVVLEDLWQNIVLYDQKERKWIQLENGAYVNVHFERPYFFLISPDERYLTYCLFSDETRIFDLNSEEYISIQADKSSNSFNRNALKSSSSGRFDGDTLYLVSDEYFLKIDLSTGICSSSAIFAPLEGSTNIATGPEELIPTNGTELGNVLTNGYHFNSGSDIWQRAGSIQEIRHANDNAFLLLEGKQSIVWLQDKNPLELRWEFRGGDSKIIDYSDSNFDGVRAIYADGRIKNWRLDDNKIFTALESCEEGSRCFTPFFSEDGSKIFLVKPDSTIDSRTVKSTIMDSDGPPFKKINEPADSIFTWLKGTLMPLNEARERIPHFASIEKYIPKLDKECYGTNHTLAWIRLFPNGERALLFWQEPLTGLWYGKSYLLDLSVDSVLSDLSNPENKLNIWKLDSLSKVQFGL